MGHNFTKLEVYELGCNLVKDVYEVCVFLPPEEKNNIISQMKRAVVSIPLNLAEGSARFTKRSSLTFFFYAYGSLREIEALFKICNLLNYIDKKKLCEMNEKIDKLSRKLYRYMKVFNDREYFDWFSKKEKKF